MVWKGDSSAVQLPAQPFALNPYAVKSSPGTSNKTDATGNVEAGNDSERLHALALLQAGGTLHEDITPLRNVAAENEEQSPQRSTRSTPLNSGENPLPPI